MLSDEVIEKVTERLVNRIEQSNTYILEQIGKSIKKVGTLTPSKAQELVQIMRYGGDYDKIVKKIAEITKLNVKDIYKIFEEVAKENYLFAEQFYKYRNKNYIPWDENIELQNQVKAIAKITADKYVNLSNTIAFVTHNAKGRVVYNTIVKTYQNVLDKAIINTGQGKETFDSAMRQAIRELVESGIRTVDYESGKSMRLESAVRMAMQGGLRDMNNQLQLQFGKEFDADGVEISVHENPAPDHELVQGKQFSNIEFKKFQNDQDAISYDGISFPAEFEGHDRRSIGQYNCYHYIFNIVLGVNKPLYTNEELQAIVDRNNKGFDFDGKHYTMYEGQQLQRKLETEIRKTKDLQITAKATGDNVLLNESQSKINALTNKYNKLNRISGLKSQIQRASVSDYNKIRVNKEEISYARKNNALWHTTENLDKMLKDDAIISPSIAVGKKINAKVKYGSQIIEFKPELLENVDKNAILYKGDGGNNYITNNKRFDNLMQMLKDEPEIYNELKFKNDLDFKKYIKKVYVRSDEQQEVINMLKENNIDYEIYEDYRIKNFAKKK